MSLLWLRPRGRPPGLRLCVAPLAGDFTFDELEDPDTGGGMGAAARGGRGEAREPEEGEEAAPRLDTGGGAREGGFPAADPAGDAATIADSDDENGDAAEAGAAREGEGGAPPGPPPPRSAGLFPPPAPPRQAPQPPPQGAPQTQFQFQQARAQQARAQHLSPPLPPPPLSPPPPPRPLLPPPPAANRAALQSLGYGGSPE